VTLTVSNRTTLEPLSRMNKVLCQVPPTLLLRKNNRIQLLSIVAAPPLAPENLLSPPRPRRLTTIIPSLEHPHERSSHPPWSVRVPALAQTRATNMRSERPTRVTRGCPETTRISAQKEHHQTDLGHITYLSGGDPPHLPAVRDRKVRSVP
jgi:hypothetical protein